MKVVNCKITIHGDPEVVETGSSTEIELSSPVTLLSLKNAIPFEGNFHLRQLVTFEDSPAWLDLNDPNMTLSLSTSKNKTCLEIQALPLSFGNNSQDLGELHLEWGFNDEDLDDTSGPGHFVSVLESAENFADRVDATAIAATRRLEEVMSSDTVQKMGQTSAALGKSITKLWSSGVSKVGNMKAGMDTTRTSQPPIPPPPEARVVLEGLFNDLTTSINTSNPEHKELIRKLGSFISPDLKVTAWKRGGFVNENPVTDLAKTGILGLRALVYFSERYTHKATAMMEAQRPCTANHYPFAIVGVNLTLMLADVLSLKERKYEGRVASFWMIFENDLEEEAFFEIFSVAMMHIDFLWTSRKATRKEFGEIIKSTKASLVEVLEKGPSSMSDLLGIATKNGLVHS
jgi:hypothetical protein